MAPWPQFMPPRRQLSFPSGSGAQGMGIGLPLRRALTFGPYHKPLEVWGSGGVRVGV